MPVLEQKHWDGAISPFADRGIRGACKFTSNCDIRKDVDTLSCGQDLKDEGLFEGTHSTSASISPSPSLSPSGSASPSHSPSLSNSPSASPSSSGSRSASASASPSGSASPSSSVSPSPSPSAGLFNVYEDLVLFWVEATDGNTYGFGDGGHIYRRYTDGYTRMVYTDSDGSIKGAIEKPSSDGTTSLQWATATSIKKKPLPGESDWSDVEEIANNLTGTDWHTMVQVGGANLIANGSYLAMVGYDDSWTNEALDLIPGNIAKTLIERNGRAVIGTVKEWDNNKGVNGMIDAEYPLAQIGTDGEVFYNDFVNSMPIFKFPGGGQVNPGGVANVVDQVNIFDWDASALSWLDKQTMGNLSMWGVFDADSDRNGVYYYGRKHKEQPTTLNLEYALEVDEIGAVANVDGTIIISYRDGTDYGVKAVDPDNKATGTWEGLEFRSPIKQAETPTVYKYVEVFMKALPTHARVAFWYKKNKGAWTQALLADGGADYEVNGGTKAVFLIGEEMDVYEPKLILYPDGNDSPEILRIRTYFD